MEKWIEIEEVPKIFFAHNYVSMKNYKNRIQGQKNVFEISYIRYNENENNNISNRKVEERENGAINFMVYPKTIDVFFDDLFETHCVGVMCQHKRFFNEDQLYVNLDAPAAERLKEIIDDLIRLYNFYPEKEHKMASLVFEFLDLFFTQHEKDVTNAKELTGEVGYVNKAKNFIKRHADKKLTLKMIADHLHISVPYLCVVFKKITGESVITYINRYKLYLIKSYVMEEGIELKEACTRVGISDPAYASRLFKKYERQTLRDFKSTNWRNPAKKGVNND